MQVQGNVESFYYLRISEIVDAIIKELSLQSVTVKYYKEDEFQKRLNSCEHLIFLEVMDEAERDRYNSMRNVGKAKYLVKRPSINFPDITVGRLIDTYKKGLAGEYESRIEAVSKIKMKTELPNDIKFVMHCFLHEVKHWKQLYDLDRNAYEFMNLDKDLEKENSEQYSLLMDQIREYYQNNDCYKLPSSLRKELERVNRAYREIPKEKGMLLML